MHHPTAEPSASTSAISSRGTKDGKTDEGSITEDPVRGSVHEDMMLTKGRGDPLTLRDSRDSEEAAEPRLLADGRVMTESTLTPDDDEKTDSHASLPKVQDMDTRMDAESTPDPAASEDPPQLSRGRRIGLMLMVAFTLAMSGGGQQGLNIALPIIQEELGIAQSDLQWISSAYALTSACFLLLSGRLADVYGRKRCFIGGIAWYAIWSLGGSFMHSGVGLIISRALAGAGASMGIPAGMGIIAANIHGKQRATAFALFAAGAPMGGGTGLVLGGVLAAYAEPTWRAILWIFAGLAVIILALAVAFVPPDPPRAKGARIDWTGAALVTSGLVLLQFTVSQGTSAPQGWRTPYIYALFIVSILALVGFFVWEYYTIHYTQRPPLLRLALFTRAKGRLAAVYFVGFVAWMGFISVGYHATLYYQQVQMTGTVGAVLRFLPCPISGLLCNFVIAKVVHRVPTQILICTGLLATGTFLAVSSREQNYWTFPFNAMYLMVIGADCLMPTGSIFVSRLALQEEQSVAAALFQTLLQLGGSMGLTFTSVMATTQTSKALATGMDHIDAHLKGLHSAFFLCSAFSYSAMLLALVSLHGIGIVSKVGSDGKPEKAPGNDEKV